MIGKKVLFITQYFYPEVFRGNDIAFDLVKRGVDVTVITAIPNYPKGKFFDGYGIFNKRCEVINGVKVIRIPLIPRGSNSIQLMLNYFSFALNSSIFILFHCLFNKYSYCLLQQLSPITTALPCIIAKRIYKIPFYSWVLDLWPESLQSAGGINNKFVLGFFSSIAKMMYKSSDKILISSKGFEESIIQKGDFKDKIIYYPNWAEDAFSGSDSMIIPEMPDGFKVVFAGNIGEAQDFKSIIEAAKLISEDDEIKLIIIGDGRKKRWVDEQIIYNKLENVIYMMGRYPIEYMKTFFTKADVMLVSLKNEQIFNLTAPAKIQAYMSVAKPIIAMMNGEGSNLINEAKCGLSVPAESPNELVEGIKSLKRLTEQQRLELGLNGKKYCDEYFNKDKCLTKLYNILNGDS